MRRETLMRLYPSSWRERYEEEFLQLIGDEPLTLQQVIDIVSGAIDARLSGGVQPAAAGGDVMVKMLKSGCQVGGMRMTTREALIAAGVLIVASAGFAAFGGWLRQLGHVDQAELVMAMSFPLSLAVSMPWTFMKGQPWRAQMAIVGMMILMLGLIGTSTLIF